MLEFRETPLYQDFTVRFGHLVSMCSQMMADPSYQPRAHQMCDYEHFRMLINSIKVQGYRIDCAPRINASRVVDGVHRICYCLVKDLPCLVHYESEM